MSIFPPILEGHHVEYHREGILTACFENDPSLRVTSRFRREASSLVDGIEERYPQTRFADLYKSSAELPYESLVVRVLNDVSVACPETAEYLDKPEPTEEFFRVRSAFERCRSTTLELGLAALLIERAVQRGYLRERETHVDGKRTKYLSLAEQNRN